MGISLLKPLTGIALIASVSLASACGSSTAPTDTATAQPTATASADQQGGQPSEGRGGGRPGVSGIIADVTDQTLQVQGQNGQTAVTWTAETTFTKQVAGTVADITVGSCVSGFGEQADGAETVTATRIAVSPAEDGSCSSGFGSGMGRGGGDDAQQAPQDGQEPPSGMPTDRPEGMPTDQPSGMPTDQPSGMPSGAPGGGGGMVAGLVTAVEGSTVTLQQTRPGSEEATTVTFTLGADATVTTTGAATAADATVGSCVTAQGETDDTGAVTATSMSLSEATDGECGTR